MRPLSRSSAIVIGASSGIDREIALRLGARGFRLGLTVRRLQALKEAAREIGEVRCLVRQMDLAAADAAQDIFREMAAELGTVDFVYLIAGIGYPNAKLDWKLVEETFLVNGVGFAALASASVKLFASQGRGHLVAVTSVAAVRPAGAAPAYGASKAFGAVYLDALRYWIGRRNLPIDITDVRPGPVATAMLKIDKPFWVVRETLI